MSSPAPVIVWFRDDLRLADNPALLAACQSGAPVLPLYVLDETSGIRPLGGAARWWLDKSLRRLATSLQRFGADLVLKRGPASEILDDLVAETGASRVYWNRLYDPAAVKRDRGIKIDLAEKGVDSRSFNAGLLNEPWEITTGAGGPFKIFSAYWRAAAPKAADLEPGPRPDGLEPFSGTVSGDSLDDWGLHPRAPDWSVGFGDWTPGEDGARHRLDAFLKGSADDYAEGRDRPDRAATSRLSPHLRFGEIGPRQVWAAARDHAEAGASRRSVETFQKELGWREFNAQLLFHFPDMARKNLDQRFDKMRWRHSRRELAAWREGRTGFPMVDAAMRQLWTTGWMHNRARMIVASFLVKDLLIDWRVGEAWFWDTLVDADLANNIGNWQWVAGSGADAAPYFRVFNPVLQGAKFDPEGDYVRQWAPELGRMPKRRIHDPWDADDQTLAEADVTLGKTYPAPIVDHAKARKRALESYEALS